MPALAGDSQDCRRLAHAIVGAVFAPRWQTLRWNSGGLAGGAAQAQHACCSGRPIHGPGRDSRFPPAPSTLALTMFPGRPIPALRCSSWELAFTVTLSIRHCPWLIVLAIWPCRGRSRVDFVFFPVAGSREHQPGTLDFFNAGLPEETASKPFWQAPRARALRERGIARLSGGRTVQSIRGVFTPSGTFRPQAPAPPPGIGVQLTHIGRAPTCRHGPTMGSTPWSAGGADYSGFHSLHHFPVPRRPSGVDGTSRLRLQGERVSALKSRGRRRGGDWLSGITESAGWMTSYPWGQAGAL